MTAIVEFKAGHRWQYSNIAGRLWVTTALGATPKEVHHAVPAGLNAAGFARWIQRNIGGRVVALR